MSGLKNVNGFVLAGGDSRRMGKDKGLIRMQGRPLVQIAADLLSSICRRIFLLAPADRYPFLDLPAIPDRPAGSGPLAALLAGLERSDTDFNLFVPCDMPFLTVAVLEEILARAEGADAVVPQDTQGRWFPLSAGYRRRCIPAIEACLAAGKRRADSFFASVFIHSLAMESYPEATFANINSPSDLRRWSAGRWPNAN